MTTSDYDFDYIIVGSGFGGSVSAMRLTQKGYSVGVIESGRRWKDEDFAKRNWNLRKFLWMPNIALYGIQRMNFLRDVFILGGAGVGGGSLNYANTHYIPPDIFFEKDTVKRLGGKKGLLPYYELAKKMLGTIENPRLDDTDYNMRDTAAEFGREHTFCPVNVGVYFGEEGKKTEDPYFMGEGPDRIGCEFCGACMTGCRKDAKNTLDKNYLYFAEKFGAKIFPENKVISVKPLSSDGSEGYEVTAIRTSGIFSPKMTFRSKGIVFSAGVLGTLSILIKMKEEGHLPRISDYVADVVRTNSEVLLGAVSWSKDVDFSKGVAITSSVHPDENTHIEPVRYARGNDFMGLMAVLLTDGGGKIPRQIRYIGSILRHPISFLRIQFIIGFAYRTMILLVMQTYDNYLNIIRKRRLLWPFKKTLTSGKPSTKRNPAYIPIANEFCRRLAKRINAIPGNTIPEVYMNAPITAHIMGGCCIRNDSDKEATDEQNRIKGYKNMLVVDASMIPENLGVNPALSITAFSERAMSFIPPKKSTMFRHLKVEKEWGVTDLIDPSERGKN